MTPHHSGYANAYGGSKSVWLAAKPIFNVRVFMKTLHRASFSPLAIHKHRCMECSRLAAYPILPDPYGNVPHSNDIAENVQKVLCHYFGAPNFNKQD